MYLIYKSESLQNPTPAPATQRAKPPAKLIQAIVLRYKILPPKNPLPPLGARAQSIIKFSTCIAQSALSTLAVPLLICLVITLLFLILMEGFVRCL